MNEHRLPLATRRPWTRNLQTLAILVAFALPLSGWIFPGDGSQIMIARECVFWVLAIALLVWVRFIEHRSLQSIGLRRPNWKTLLWGTFAAAVMIAGMALIYLVVFPAIGEKESAAKLGAINALPLALRVAIVLRAAIFEELFYRGFAIERSSEITGWRWFAAILSLAAFTLAHIGYWGIGHVIVAAFGGVVLTALYLWRRDLAANSLAHFLTDGVGFLLS